MINIKKFTQQCKEASNKRTVARCKYTSTQADVFIIDGLRVEYAWHRLLALAPKINDCLTHKDVSKVQSVLKEYKRCGCDSDYKLLCALKRLLPDDLKLRDAYIDVYKMTQFNVLSIGKKNENIR